MVARGYTVAMETAVRAPNHVDGKSDACCVLVLTHFFNAVNGSVIRHTYNGRFRRRISFAVETFATVGFKRYDKNCKQEIGGQ